MSEESEVPVPTLREVTQKLNPLQMEGWAKEIVDIAAMLNRHRKDLHAVLGIAFLGEGIVSPIRSLRESERLRFSQETKRALLRVQETPTILTQVIAHLRQTGAAATLDEQFPQLLDPPAAGAITPQSAEFRLLTQIGLEQREIERLAQWPVLLREEVRTTLQETPLTMILERAAGELPALVSQYRRALVDADLVDLPWEGDPPDFKRFLGKLSLLVVGGAILIANMAATNLAVAKALGLEVALPDAAASASANFGGTLLVGGTTLLVVPGPEQSSRPEEREPTVAVSAPSPIEITIRDGGSDCDEHGGWVEREIKVTAAETAGNFTVQVMTIPDPVDEDGHRQSLRWWQKRYRFANFTNQVKRYTIQVEVRDSLGRLTTREYNGEIPPRGRRRRR
jgi:hypothetical protein